MHDLDRFADLIERLKPSFAEDPNLRLGIAPHSLRAVPDEALCDVVALADAIDAEAPIHIHVAEQVKEVRDCLEWCGARPVRHLFDAAPVGPRWCLVHATHMDDAETERSRAAAPSPGSARPRRPISATACSTSAAT